VSALSPPFRPVQAVPGCFRLKSVSTHWAYPGCLYWGDAIPGNGSGSSQMQLAVGTIATNYFPYQPSGDISSAEPRDT
jgi:hypothetical protein